MYYSEELWIASFLSFCYVIVAREAEYASLQVNNEEYLDRKKE